MNDVLISSESFLFRAGKISDVEGQDKFEPEPHGLNIDSRLEEWLDQVISEGSIEDHAKRNWPSAENQPGGTARLGAFACSECVIKSERIVAQIKSNSRKVIGIEMESHGFLFAAEHVGLSKTVAFACKGVCDFADKEKNDAYRARASFLAARFIYELLRQKGGDLLDTVLS